MEEIWKDIKGTDGKYQVSNFGNVRKILPQSNLRGYRVVTVDGKLHLVHRLVAEAFLDNDSNLPIINHKDEVRSNNRADNLEWCDYAYNNRYGTRPYKLRKPIIAVMEDGTIEEYDSLTIASNALQVSKSAISHSLKEGYKTKKRRFFYKSEFDE